MIYARLAFVSLVYSLIFFIFLKMVKRAIKKGSNKEASIASAAPETKSTKVRPKVQCNCIKCNGKLVETRTRQNTITCKTIFRDSRRLECAARSFDTNR